MKYLALLALVVAGCSSAPLADLMDTFSPGRLPGAQQFYGGVGNVTQALPPSTAPVVAPGAPVPLPCDTPPAPVPPPVAPIPR